MELMQWNFLLEQGVLSFDAKSGKIEINYDHYRGAVGKLLSDVLAIQYQGNKASADSFIEKYTNWNENLHGVVAKNIRNKKCIRFRIFKYAALGE